MTKDNPYQNLLNDVRHDIEDTIAHLLKVSRPSSLRLAKRLIFKLDKLDTFLADVDKRNKEDLAVPKDVSFVSKTLVLSNLLQTATTKGE